MDQEQVALKPKQRKDLGYLLIGSALMLFFLLAYPKYQIARDSLAWPSVEGTVVSSSVEKRHNGDTNTYRADVRFAYIVDGREYVSNQLYLMSPHSYTSRRWKVMDTVASYPLGTSVTVFYNPNTPSLGTLYRGPQTVHYGLLIASISVLLIGMHQIRRGIKEQDPDYRAGPESTAGEQNSSE